MIEGSRIFQDQEHFTEAGTSETPPLHLASDIKMILNLAGNCLINQHSDINRTSRILKDTSKCEFIVCSDIFMTASARYADILLPGVSMFECENITLPWQYGDFLGFGNQVIEPLYECRFEYDWLCEVAEKIGLGREFSLGKNNGWKPYTGNCEKQNRNFRNMRNLRRREFTATKIILMLLHLKKSAVTQRHIPSPQKAGRLRSFLQKSTGPNIKTFSRLFPGTWSRRRARGMPWRRNIPCSSSDGTPREGATASTIITRPWRKWILRCCG